jgi:plasmid stabilization system protein ParE
VWAPASQSLIKYRVLVSKKAADDVIRNTNWWAAHHSQEQADRWEAAILAKIYSLDSSPDSNALAYENLNHSYELREALFGLGSRPGYRILFTIVEDAVTVLTVKAVEEDWINPDKLPAVRLSGKAPHRHGPYRTAV